MKILKYPLIVALLAAALYYGLARTGYIRVQPTRVLVTETHTVDAHSNAHSRVENAHSTVEVTQLPELCVKTHVPDGYLNLRQDAGMQYAVITILHEGDALEYLGEENGNWLYVQIADKQGWVYSKYLGEC